MTHVTDRLAAWLGGELDPAATAAVEEHLGLCAACRREADAQRAAWEALASLATAPPRGSLWPGVRERTLGAPERGWFFGSSPVARGVLAAMTLAIGVLGGRLTGTLGGTPAAQAEDDGTLAAVWLEESTWHADSEGALADAWLAVASDDDRAAGATGSPGGSR